MVAEVIHGMFPVLEVGRWPDDVGGEGSVGSGHSFLVDTPQNEAEPYSYVRGQEMHQCNVPETAQGFGGTLS